MRNQWPKVLCVTSRDGNRRNGQGNGLAPAGRYSG